MCGIIGLFNPVGEIDPRLRSRTDLALQAIAHRGPNGSATFHASRISLGHRKLTILDDSSRSNQPYHYGGLTLAFNGEIYNYRELAASLGLDRQDLRWDGEILANAVCRWGDSAWERLDGDFAVAVYDHRKNRLSLVRDRAGAKPLFLHRDARKIAFASEIKALQLLLSLQLELSRERFLSELLLGSWSPRDGTCFDAIEPLPPACRLAVDSTGARLTRYWRPPRPATPDIGRLTGSLVSSVRQRLIGPPSKAIFLSGGADSGLVATVAARAGAVTAYTADHGDRAHDEVSPAGDLCARLGVKLVRVAVDEEGLGLDTCTALCRALEEPPTDLVFYSAWALYRAAASDGLRVALTGQANDELWHGYSREQPLISALEAPFDPRRMASRLRHRLWSVGAASVSDGTMRKKPFWGGDWVRDFLAQERDIELLAALRSTGQTRRLPVQFRTSLGKHLDQEDRIGMAHSIESRAPLMSNSLIELGISAGSNQCSGKHDKHWYRCAAEPIIGSLAKRPKRSFPGPILSKAGELQRFALEQLIGRKHDPILGPLVNPDLTEQEIRAIVVAAPALAIRAAGLSRFAQLWGPGQPPEWRQ